MRGKGEARLPQVAAHAAAEKRLRQREHEHAEVEEEKRVGRLLPETGPRLRHRAEILRKLGEAALEFASALDCGERADLHLTHRRTQGGKGFRDRPSI